MGTDNLNKSIVDLDNERDIKTSKHSENHVSHVLNVGKHNLSPHSRRTHRFCGSSSPSRNSISIPDAMRNPATVDKYNNIIHIIMSRVTESRSQQIDKPLPRRQKPSQLLSLKETLLIIHKLWLKRLPQHIRPHWRKVLTDSQTFVAHHTTS